MVIDMQVCGFCLGKYTTAGCGCYKSIKRSLEIVKEGFQTIAECNRIVANAVLHDCNGNSGDCDCDDCRKGRR